MSFTIEELLRRGGPCRITLWVNEGSAQANIQEPGSDGWACTTRKNAAEALHAALSDRPLFRGRTDAIQARQEAEATPARLVMHKPAAPVAPVRRVVRRR